MVENMINRIYYCEGDVMKDLGGSKEWNGDYWKGGCEDGWLWGKEIRIILNLFKREVG